MIWKLWLFLVLSWHVCMCVNVCIYFGWLGRKECTCFLFFASFWKWFVQQNKNIWTYANTKWNCAINVYAYGSFFSLSVSNGSAFEIGKIRTQNCNWCKQEKQADKQTNKQLFLHASINKCTPTNPPICFILARFNDVAVHIPMCYGINKNISDAKKQKQKLPKELINKIWNIETFKSDQLE